MKDKKPSRGPKPRDEKARAVVQLPPPEKRAKGVKLPPGNPTLAARRFDVAKLPENLAALYRKVEGHKDGVKLGALCPKSAAGRYARWLIRTLVNMDALEAGPEPKAEKAVAKPKASRQKSSKKAAAAKTPSRPKGRDSELARVS